ncbi:hypothetical protein DFQ05_1706 [Winogradskyella wandonensis]|uniref:Uncharacterized protein n=1 Tax=Winogradskyella wandonensis TaxID=1442586 RepID=A0A4R1KTS1_9FLAO|nr:hypothetical protein DFQ05_1706 [Winogradskyella wandonensis]
MKNYFPSKRRATEYLNNLVQNEKITTREVSNTCRRTSRES